MCNVIERALELRLALDCLLNQGKHSKGKNKLSNLKLLLIEWGLLEMLKPMLKVTLTCLDIAYTNRLPRTFNMPQNESQSQGALLSQMSYPSLTSSMVALRLWLMIAATHRSLEPQLQKQQLYSTSTTPRQMTARCTVYAWVSFVETVFCLLLTSLQCCIQNTRMCTLLKQSGSELGFKQHIRCFAITGRCTTSQKFILCSSRILLNQTT